jgi:hypothetical protein
VVKRPIHEVVRSGDEIVAPASNYRFPDRHHSPETPRRPPVHRNDSLETPVEAPPVVVVCCSVGGTSGNGGWRKSSPRWLWRVNGPTKEISAQALVVLFFNFLSSFSLFLFSFLDLEF